MNKVTKAINKVLRESGRPPREFTEGACEFFAHKVLSTLHDPEDVSVDSNFEDMTPRAGGHCWLVYKDRYYDAETPKGVNSIDQLPVFQRDR